MIEQKNFQSQKHLQSQYVAVKILNSNILWPQDCLQYFINIFVDIYGAPEGILTKYWRW